MPYEYLLEYSGLNVLTKQCGNYLKTNTILTNIPINEIETLHLIPNGYIEVNILNSVSESALKY